MPYPTASSGNERTFSSLHNLISTTDISSKITYTNLITLDSQPEYYT